MPRNEGEPLSRQIAVINCSRSLAVYLRVLDPGELAPCQTERLVGISRESCAFSGGSGRRGLPELEGLCELDHTTIYWFHLALFHYPLCSLLQTCLLYT